MRKLDDAPDCTGTFFEDVLGGECRNRRTDKPTCGHILANEQANMDEERAKKLWQVGFVQSFVVPRT